MDEFHSPVSYGNNCLTDIATLRGAAILENLNAHLIVFLMMPAAGLLPRIVARVIDLVLIAIAVEVLHRAGFFAGFVYVLIADGLFDGRSPGKILLRLRVVREDGTPCTVRESILRNIIIAVGLLLWMIPLIGWVLFLGILVLELIVLLGSDSRRRIGDAIAGTDVVEVETAGKV